MADEDGVIEDDDDKVEGNEEEDDDVEVMGSVVEEDVRNPVEVENVCLGNKEVGDEVRGARGGGEEVTRDISLLDLRSWAGTRPAGRRDESEKGMEEASGGSEVVE